MIKPEFPFNEAERLHALRSLQIIDTSDEERFDRITRMAKHIFNVEISLVSIIDENRQWFKSKQGIDVPETPREVSFCGHAINQNGLLIIPNAIEDERFYDNPLVTGKPYIRFYAGYPLKLRAGINLGTLCLIDSKPRHLSEEEMQILTDLGAIIEQEIRSIQLATLDELTSISNRRGFMALGENIRKTCHRKKISMSIILFDLNKFKPINDKFGHHEGNFALKKFAEAMCNVFYENNLIGRLGGDEFVVMLIHANDEQIDIALNRFKAEILAVNKAMNKPYIIEYSAGVASFPHDTEQSLEKMLEKADAAMYKKKKDRLR
ncbi:sensor domain-containing diguanylate cyclase [Vibrio hibernica]|uniref:sensor domain-containing diguanylate cyclase n=1 Tax=Vibrio hibernica TaxID=2587465 RepID=UPI001881759A|nr:sensor domain-containing diguanylate cyclase [Vibrio hibernica]